MEAEPENLHDTNAVGVHTQVGDMVGHVTHELARNLATEIGDSRLYGKVISGHTSRWKCTIELD